MSELDNLIVGTFGSRRSNARIQAVEGIDVAPDEAARAVQLGQDSGQDPNAILGDLPTFERQHRQFVTGGLIERSPDLQGYINANPMAAKVSSDDWGSLGKVAEKLKNFDGFLPIIGHSRLPRHMLEAIKGAGEGAKSLIASSLMGYGAMAPEIAARQLKELEKEPEPVGESPEERAAARTKRGVMGRQSADVLAQRKEALRGRAETPVAEQPLYKAGKAVESFAKEALSAKEGWEESWTREIGSGAGSMVAGLGLSAIPYVGPALATSVFLGAGMGEAAERAIKAGATEEQARKAAELGTVAGAVDMMDMLLLSLGTTGKALSAAKAIGTRAIYGAMTQGGQEGVQELIQNAIEQGIYNPDKALHENVAKSAAIGMIVGGIAAGGLTAANRQMDIRREAETALGVAELYTRSGMEPPVGTHWILDTLKSRQAEKEAEVFDDLMSEVFENQTRLRAPEIFRNLPAQFGEKSILISGEAVQEAYGQNAPEPGDGKLGFVPNILEQYQSSLLTGADIIVPLADYVAFVDKNFHANVKEDIRYRDGGMTLKEAKEFDPVAVSQMIDAWHGSPHEFDAFSMEKIGTGEGAQSYGHGIYFAENPIVAESYKTAGRRSARKYKINGKEVDAEGIMTFSNAATPEGVIALAMDFTGDKTKALDLVNQEYAKDPDAVLAEAIQILETGSVEWMGAGNTYRVRIRADKDQFLDWDKPLSEQPEGVKRLAEWLSKTYPDQDFQLFTGEGVVRALQSVGKENEKLLEAGIPGIKYLDQGSRGPVPKAMQHVLRAQGETDIPRTYNFVLFDESLIEILDRNGEAINAVRKAAHLRSFDEIRADAEAAGAEWAYIGAKQNVLHAEMENLPPEYLDLATAIGEWIDRVIPHVGGHIPVFSIQSDTGGRSSGLFVTLKNAAPLIYWSFDALDTFGTVKHEAIHFLRQYNLLTETEWNVLSRAARDGGWITKHGILDRYEGLTPEQMLEEAIAEEYSKWNRSEETKALGPIEEIFQKLRDIAAGLLRTIKGVLGEKITAEDIFRQIEGGEVGARKPGKPRAAEAFSYSRGGTKQPELPGTRRLEDTQIAKGAAFGMTEAQYKRYEKLIKDQHLRDQDYIRRKAIEAETRRQTKEWKANEKAVREEVLEDTTQTPVIAATNFFLNGQVPGAEKLRFKPKLAWNALTAEERKALPKDIAAPGQLEPDDVAPLLGFQTGKEMITAMMTFEQAKGELSSREFLKQTVDAEVARRMEERFGVLSENILREAEEHVFGSLQMDILHEETIALAVKADLEFTFSKEDIESAVREAFGQLRHMDIKSHRFTKEAGKAGKEVEAQLLKGDFKEAFVAKQKQFYSSLITKMAIKYEKDRKVFDKLAKRLGNDKIKTMDREWVDFGQKMLSNANLPINRFPQFLQEAMERSGYDTLPDFVAGKLGEGWDGMAEVDPALAQGQFTSFENQTVDQFYATKVSIQAMVDAGRSAGRQIATGEKQDWQNLKDTFIQNMQALPVRKPGQFKWRYAFDASLTKMEEIIKDLDLRQEAGPLWNFLIRPMAEAKHTEYDMQEALVKRMTRIRKQFGRSWIKSLDETIPNTFLRDPNDGSLFDLTRQNMINIMLNFGTKSNIKKFVEGYTYPNHKTEAPKLETQLRKLFDDHATKEDWDFVQEMWDIFEDWRGPAEEMYYELGGQSKIWYPPDEIMTRHGPIKGGYYPIIEDPSRPGDFKGRNKPVAPNAHFGPNYNRATIANNYTIERTGAVWPVDFNYPLEKLASRMQQMIHDISYRRAVMQANKVIEDKEIMFNVRRHYGPEYADQFKPWIADISNHFNIDEMAMSGFYGPMRKMRMNLVIHALGLNLGVIGSPDVGAFNPKAATEVLLNRGPDVALAWAKSREIPHTFKNMDRDFREATERNFRRLKLNDVQSTAARWAFWPVVKVSQGFRIITWVSQYKAALARGESDGDAVAIADSAVRTRHGSGGIPDLPAVMRSNEGWKAITMFYGYFNTMYNWQRQIPGELRKGNMVNAMTAFYGTTLIGAAFGALLFNRPKKDDTWYTIMAKAIGGQFAGYVPFAREGYQWIVEGQLPNTPYASLIKAIGQGVGDVTKVYKGKKVEKPIQHVANVAGMTFGLPLAQVGRTGQFLSDVANNRQRPKNFWDWWWGVRFGESKPKR